jgi:hypothetical protein
LFLYLLPMCGRSASAGAIVLGLVLSGCAPELEVTYGKNRGKSLNGTSVFTRMLRERGCEVRTAIRLNNELKDWAVTIIRFAPYPGPPSLLEARWYRDWLAIDDHRRLVYVVRDFDAVSEYWQNVRDALAELSESDRLSEAEEKRNAAANWVDKLPPKSKPAADSREWFAIDSAWNPPRVCGGLSGPWARGIEPASAGLTVHEPLNSAGGFTLLVGDGKPLVMEKVIGRGRVLLIANGSFLLNEGVVNPARRSLAARTIEWAAQGGKQVAMVEGAFVLERSAEPATIWGLLWRVPSMMSVSLQAGLAALLAALARAPRLGRPRPDPPSGADRPAEHALALGALLARAKALDAARELLDRYRRWRYARTARPPCVGQSVGRPQRF